MTGRNFEIGEWRVEVGLGRIVGKSRSVHLEPQVMKVLACLAATPSEVVTKETLIATQWRSTVVSDAALARCVSQIRTAMGDDRKNPRYIETVPKIGYRLIAEVKRSEPGQSRPLWKLIPVAALLLVAPLMMMGTTARPPQVESLIIDAAEVITRGHFHDTEILHASARVLADRLEAGIAMHEGRLVVASAVDTMSPQANANYRLVSRIEARDQNVHFGFELIKTSSGDVVCRDSSVDMAADVFDVASEFASDVIRCVGGRFSLEQLEELSGVPTRNILAFDAFRKAQKEFSTSDHATLQNAIILYEQAIDEDPSFGLAWAFLAYSLELDARNWGAGRIDDANAASQRALSLAPGQPETHYAFGRVREFVGDFEAALLSYERAIELDPDHIVALYSAAELYFHRRDFEKAEAMFRKTLQLDPRMHSAMSLLGQLYQKMGDIEEARFWLSSSVREVPLKIHANETLAVLDIAEGEYEQARLRCERLNRFFPGSYYCLQIRALVSLHDADWPTASSLFSEMRRRWPEDEYAMLGYAQVLIAESKDAEAAKLLNYVEDHSRERVESGERSWHHRWTLAAALAVKGEKYEALEWLDEAAAAGRRDYLWDLADPMFSELHNDVQFQNYISATRVLPTSDAELSTASRLAPTDRRK